MPAVEFEGRLPAQWKIRTEWATPRLHDTEAITEVPKVPEATGSLATFNQAKLIATSKYPRSIRLPHEAREPTLHLSKTIRRRVVPSPRGHPPHVQLNRLHGCELFARRRRSRPRIRWTPFRIRSLRQPTTTRVFAGCQVTELGLSWLPRFVFVFAFHISVPFFFISSVAITLACPWSGFVPSLRSWPKNARTGAIWR